jgi:hypothetical protein
MGGLIGFGISHSYPVSRETDIKNLTLKGLDAAVMNVFKSLGLDGGVKAIYDNFLNYKSRNVGENEMLSKESDFCWLSAKLLIMPELLFVKRSHLWEEFEKQGALLAFSIDPRRDSTPYSEKTVTVTYNKEEDESFEIPAVHWMTPMSKLSHVSCPYVLQGKDRHEGSLSCEDGYLNLIFTVPVEGEGTRKAL